MEERQAVCGVCGILTKNPYSLCDKCGEVTLDQIFSSEGDEETRCFPEETMSNAKDLLRKHYLSARSLICMLDLRSLFTALKIPEDVLARVSDRISRLKNQLRYGTSTCTTANFDKGKDKCEEGPPSPQCNTKLPEVLQQEFNALVGIRVPTIDLTNENDQADTADETLIRGKGQKRKNEFRESEGLKKGQDQVACGVKFQRISWWVSAKQKKLVAKVSRLLEEKGEKWPDDFSVRSIGKWLRKRSSYDEDMTIVNKNDLLRMMVSVLEEMLPREKEVVAETA